MWRRKIGFMECNSMNVPPAFIVQPVMWRWPVMDEGRDKLIRKILDIGVCHHSDPNAFPIDYCFEQALEMFKKWKEEPNSWWYD